MTGRRPTEQGQELESLIAEPATLGVPTAYRELLRRAAVQAEELRRLNQVNVARIVLEVVLTAGSLAAVPILCAVIPHPGVWVLGFVLSIRNANCLAQLIHLSDHGSLFKNPRLNTSVGNACAYLLGYTRAGHRLSHLQHHLYLNTDRDPDLVWGTPQQTSRDLLWAWVYDFLCLSAGKRLLQYSQTEKKTYSVKPWRTLDPMFVARGLRVLWPVIVVQMVVLGAYSALVGPLSYFVLYVLPILTFYPAQIRLRSTVEHSFDAGYEPKSVADLWVTRSTQAGWLERFIFAPYGIHYHFEHHLFPGAPHYHLKEVRDLLRRAGVTIPLTPGYLSFVIRKIKMERRHLAAQPTA